MVGERNQNVFVIQIDVSSFVEFEISEFDISRFDCIIIIIIAAFVTILCRTNVRGDASVTSLTITVDVI